MSHRNWIGGAMLAVMALCGATQAQESGKAMVTAAGQATIKAQPDLVRVTIELSGDGKDIAEALTKLAAEKESAMGKLGGVGAAPDAITMSDPSVGGSGGATDARDMAMAMMQGRRTPQASASKQIKVVATLEARVPLKGTTPQDKLIEGAALVEKVKAAFARKLTAQEQEIMEEMQGQAPNQPRPGEPQFAFVHAITEAERAKATADALAQAKASAARLAAAAGAKLGGIRQLSETAASTSGSNAEQYQNYYYARAMGGASGSASPNEATSPQPGPVTFVVTVSVGYALE
jgi:uncharacterized protein YggE